MTEPMVDADQWLDLYGDNLYQYALARVRDAQLAEDLVQDTLIAALKAQERFEQRSKVKTWLIGILKHKIIDHLRKATRETTVDDVETLYDDLRAESFTEHGHWKIDIASWSDPDRSYEQERFWEVLNSCLDELPEKMRTVFFLRELEGMSAEDICKALPVSSTNNVWVMLSRLRFKLRQCLELRWFESEAGGS